MEYDIVSSQLLLICCLSGERQLLDLYQTGEDLYSYMAKMMFGRTDIGTDERDIYKRMILQLLYGAGIETIQKEMHCDGMDIAYADIMSGIHNFYKQFSAIAKYSDHVKRSDVMTLPDGRKWNMQDIQSYKRLAYIMQYTEAVILRKTLVQISGSTKNKKAWIYLSIHDSVWIETVSKDQETVGEMVRKCFDKSFQSIFNNSNRIKIKEVRYGRQKL